MRAVVQDEYGEATQVLRLAEVDRPAIADGEVLVRVHAAGVDRGVWHMMTGRPYLIRLIGYGVRAPKSPVPGQEVAGVVEAVGTGVTAVAPGDEVYGIGVGTFAEYTTVHQDKIALKPKNLTFEQAAVAPISGLSALQAVRDAGAVRAGQRVLVIGASGGVGTFAVQLAKAFGAEVTGVCGPAKVDLVRSLGADHVIDYTRADITDGAERYDVVLDAGGHRSLSTLRRVLTERGTLVIIGSETGGRWLGGFDRALRAPLVSRFVGQTLRPFVNSENAPAVDDDLPRREPVAFGEAVVDRLVALTELIEAGRVTPVVDRTYPLGEAGTAIQRLVDGHARGKVVVTV